ncbi:MAG: hypothetical protein IKC10_00620 [Alphaproteobacteria bacterium]|nr:hypothetical protein [Alphaproteobacteria bacterium]
MKKIVVSLCLFVLLITACTNFGVVFKDDIPAPASYTDWDRAIRVDADMQTMYSATPRKIEKPIDMYMAMALALKYNYTRRLVSYQQSMIEVGKDPQNRLPEIFSSAGYVNTDNKDAMDSELKLAWNILDISTVYYQSKDDWYKTSVAYEQSRKVIHNLMQETRVLYWKALSAQRLLPLIDDMIEYMTLDVDELNAKASDLAKQGASLNVAELERKREFMQATKELSYIKRDLETANVRLASLMGFHPSTEFTLVGKEMGNFDLPEIKSSLSEMEWVALTNRPELRVRDLVTDIDEVVASFKIFSDPGNVKYKTDSNYYNRAWSKKAKEVGMEVFEKVNDPKYFEAEALRRQRMTNLILTQVYVAWARYMSAVEDYQIAQELAYASEDIAEDTTITSGARASDSQLESARAIGDESKAMIAYVKLQDALGNLYATLGMDAIPYYMLNEKPSKIAIYLRGVLEKWRKGEFLPDNRPYMLDVPTKRPPVNLSSPTLMPDLVLESGQKIEVYIPQSIIDKLDPQGAVSIKAGMVNDTPLPDWLMFDEAKRAFIGMAMPGNIGTHQIKAYISDSEGRVGFITFAIKITDVYVPSIKMKGLTEGRTAQVLKRCVGRQCTDEYITDVTIGRDVSKKFR